MQGVSIEMTADKRASLYDIPEGCICMGDGLLGVHCEAKGRAVLKTKTKRKDVPVRKWRTPRGRARFKIDIIASRRAMADGTLSQEDREFIDAVCPGLMEKLGPLVIEEGAPPLETIVGGARGFTFTVGDGKRK